MATRSIKPKREDTLLSNWQSTPERAPSEVRQESSTPARIIALAALFCVAVGGLALISPLLKLQYLVPPTLGIFFFGIGLVGLLYHAFSEKDEQFRRLYLFLGVMLALAGILSRLLPMVYFLPAGPTGVVIGLLFSFAVLRNDSDESLKRIIMGLFGALGGVLCLLGFAVGTFSEAFLLPEGFIYLVVGLSLVCAFIAAEPGSSPWGFRAGFALGLIGMAAVLVAGLRAYFLDNYFVPTGLVIISMGLLYLAFSLGICSDWSIVVMTRRELASFFYSPIAHLVIFGMALIGWLMFYMFVGRMINMGQILEPIVRFYVLDIVPIVCVLFLAPVLTMRLLSEEKRTGTLEVLMTAPVSEVTVVLSKFLASMAFFFLAILPWALYLVAIRVGGGQPFDYRPALSFFIALFCTSAGFLSMGLFFSSLTRNQIVAAVLTFAGMIAHIGVYLVQGYLRQQHMLSNVLEYVSFIDLWINTLEGTLAPRYLMFHISLAILFLYLTTKVLEIRKWW